MQLAASNPMLMPLHNRVATLGARINQARDYTYKPDKLSRIKRLTGGYVEAFLPDIGLGAICTVAAVGEARAVKLVVVKQTRDATILVPLQSLIGVRLRDRIRYSERANRIQVSQALMGQDISFDAYDSVARAGLNIAMRVQPSGAAQRAQSSLQPVATLDPTVGKMIYGGAYFFGEAEGWSGPLRQTLLGPAFDVVLSISPQPWLAFFGGESEDLRQTARVKCLHLITPGRFGILGQNISLAIASAMARGFAEMGLNVALLADEQVCQGAKHDAYVLDVDGDQIASPVQFHHVYEQNGQFDNGSVTHLFGISTNS